MNLRKIKLALTVGLLNRQGNNRNLLQSIKDLMTSFSEEVGNFIGLSLVKKDNLNKDQVTQTYSIQYEKCTLAIDLIYNQISRDQYIYTFELQG